MQNDLEEALASYPGTILLVSHDRYFLNRVCNGIVALEGDGKLVYTPGDYDYYLEKRAERMARQTANANVNTALRPARSAEKPATPTAVSDKPRKLSFKEQRELAQLEARMPELEAQIQALEAIFQEPDFYAKHGSESHALNQKLEELRSELDTVGDRWLELAEIQG